MLTKLLEKLNEGAHTTSSLAHKLNISLPLVHQMLDDLAQQGYLSPIAPACDAILCATCPLTPDCAIKPFPQTWALTQKGDRLIQKLKRETRGNDES